MSSKRTYAVALASAAVLASAAIVSAAPTPYTADLTVLNSSQTDFATYSQIGMTGANNVTNTHAKYTWKNGSVVLGSRYGVGNSAELILHVAGNNSNGVFGDAVTSVEFKPYLEGSLTASSIRFGMSTRQSPSAALTGQSNLYPDYRVDYDGTNLVLSEQVGYGATRQRVLASQALSSAIAAGTLYQLDLSAQGTSATSDVTLSASLYQVGNLVPLATVTGVDHPKGATQEGGGTADWADSGEDLHLTGQTGIYGGSTASSQSYAGIEVTSFSVAVPEPGTAAVAFAAASLGLSLRRRARVC